VANHDIAHRITATSHLESKIVPAMLRGVQHNQRCPGLIETPQRPVAISISRKNQQWVAARPAEFYRGNPDKQFLAAITVEVESLAHIFQPTFGTTNRVNYCDSQKAIFQELRIGRLPEATVSDRSQQNYEHRYHESSCHLTQAPSATLLSRAGASNLKLVADNLPDARSAVSQCSPARLRHSHALLTCPLPH